MKHKLSRQQARWPPFLTVLETQSMKQMLCSGEQILKRGYKNSETETIACSWINFFIAQAVQPSHWKNDTSVQENEEETLPRNKPCPVIKGLEEQNLEDDIVLHHGHVTYPKTQTDEEAPRDTT